MMMNIFFMCLLAICVSSLERYLFVSCVCILCPFFDVIICFVCVEFGEFFLGLGYQPYVCSVICNIFSYSMDCLFVLLTASVAVQKLLILKKSPKFIFIFDCFTLGACLERSYCGWGHLGGSVG